MWRRILWYIFHWLFGVTYCRHSETSVNFYQITQHHIQEDILQDTVGLTSSLLLLLHPPLPLSPSPLPPYFSLFAPSSFSPLLLLYFFFALPLYFFFFTRSSFFPPLPPYFFLFAPSSFSPLLLLYFFFFTRSSFFPPLPPYFSSSLLPLSSPSLLIFSSPPLPLSPLLFLLIFILLPFLTFLEWLYSGMWPRLPIFWVSRSSSRDWVGRLAPGSTRGQACSYAERTPWAAFWRMPQWSSGQCDQRNWR